MWLLAEERHKHRQALCKWLLHNCNPCEECNIRVVPMVRICHHIPDAKLGKPDAGAASVIYNAMRRKNERHDIIAAARAVCNATRRMGDGSRLILCQRVRGSARAVRAVRNTWVFQTETRVVADEGLKFQIHLSDAEAELRTWSLAGMERITNQLERAIHGITSNEQKRFKKEFSIRLVEFEARWKTFRIQALRNPIEQHIIHFAYPKMHIVSHIS